MPKDLNILKMSKDPKQLVDTAIEFAASDQQADLDTLLSYLSTNEFLDRLDSADDYNRPPQRLRLAKIFGILIKNPKPKASHGVLVSLTTKKDFTAIEPRQELLIRALVEVRPSPPPAIKFWESHFQPDSTWRHVTSDAVADNQSQPAVDLLEKELTNPRHDRDEKIAWMQDAVLRHRNDVPLLITCQRMITATLDPSLKPFLVEALFDYRRDEWFLSCDPPEPPELMLASKEAKALLIAIAEYVLDSNNKIAIDARTRLVVEAKLRILKPPP